MPNNSPNIIPACFAETLLMKTLGYSCENHHQNGDGNVINNLTKTAIKNKKLKLIGVLDKPIGISPSHIQSDYVDKETGPYGIILKKHLKYNNYIIFINELLEDWIIRVGDSKDVDCPYKNLQTFKSEMKRSNLLSNPKLIKYFEKINSKKPEPFKKINTWIKQINS